MKGYNADYGNRRFFHILQAGIANPMLMATQVHEERKGMATIEELERRVTALETAQRQTAETQSWMASTLGRIAAVQDGHTKLLEAHGKTLDDHSKTLDDHTNRLERIEGELREVKGDLKGLRADLPAMLADAVRDGLRER